ncbi:ejaculatory bulb-specific protein 3 [Condylostylus longicornis]|uniref:ejaculatory bulb-specific protein 3 n=1 Tax=Condylostylus longicornis TaxID=2530218 RepID=UPI00244E326E|nr:ejaculatory bulb-specific protein 3 [Condylostylus longicornis]
MKYFVFALLALVAVVAADEQYTTKYDNIDLEEILKSDRLFKNYYNCLLDKGKCTPDGRELKRVLPDALKTECSKCSERQKQGVERVLKFLIDNKQVEWKDLSAKYDPEGIYVKKYEAEARARGYEIPDFIKAQLEKN